MAIKGDYVRALAGGVLKGTFEGYHGESDALVRSGGAVHLVPASLLVSYIPAFYKGNAVAIAPAYASEYPDCRGTGFVTAVLLGARDVFEVRFGSHTERFFASELVKVDAASLSPLDRRRASLYGQGFDTLDANEARLVTLLAHTLVWTLHREGVELPAAMKEATEELIGALHETGLGIEGLYIRYVDTV